MRVASQTNQADIALSDLIGTPRAWSAADLAGVSHALDRKIRISIRPDRLIYYKAQLRELQGDTSSAASWLDRLKTAGPGETLDTYDYDRHLAFTAKCAERASLLRSHGLTRPVYLTAMPGADGPNAAAMLAHLLGAFRVRTAKGGWAGGALVPRWLDTVLGGCAVTQDQFPATAENLAILAPRADLRLTVHVRHPADALAAIFEALSCPAQSPGLHHQITRELGVAAFEFPDERRETQLSWLVRTVYPALIAWMQDWLAAHRRLGERLAFTRQEDLAADRPGMVGAVLAHSRYDPGALPALDGGRPTPLRTALARFEETDEAGANPEQAADHTAVFSPSHGEYLAQWNESPVFTAFDYVPVEPRSLSG